jgi:hypothetical protein
MEHCGGVGKLDQMEADQGWWQMKTKAEGEGVFAALPSFRRYDFSDWLSG